MYTKIFLSTILLSSLSLFPHTLHFDIHFNAEYTCDIENSLSDFRVNGSSFKCVCGKDPVCLSILYGECCAFCRDHLPAFYSPHSSIDAQLSDIIKGL